MVSHLFKLFPGKKPNRRGVSDANQSMIDIISENVSVTNDSFRSHQPHLNSSIADLGDLSRRLTDASPTTVGGNFPQNFKPKANITSVFNTPKKTSIMEDLYEILQEHVIDQVGEMIMYNKKPALVAHPQTEKVQAVDFEIYIAKLKNAYDKYRKMNHSRLQKNKGAEKVNVLGSLLRCYEEVPGHYFEERFIFNFKYLTQDKARIMEVQEQLGDFLDLVEVNLYHQISSKFQAFLDVILKLNQMEIQIQNSLYSIKFLRTFNADLKNTCSDKVSRTLRLKRRKINLEKTLAIMELLNVVKKTLPTLVQLIHKNNIDSAVKLVKTSEETYKNKLNQVKALKNFHLNFNEARNTLEKMLNNEFEDKAINYFTSAFSYNKTVQNTHNMSIEISMVEESFMNVSTVDFAGPVDDDSTGTYQLYWTLNDFSQKADVENHLAKIVLEFIKIKNFSLTTYKAKLFEFMKKTHRQFLNDMNEYLDAIQKEEGHSLNPKGKFDLNIKFTLFYFELFKRFLTRHFKLNNKILSTLINYYNTTYVEKSDSENYIGRPVLDVKAMKVLVETVQEFYLALGMIFKQFLDRFAEIIALNQIDNININQFAKLRAVFEEFIHYFNQDLKLEQTLNSWIVTERESLRKPLLNLIATLSDKFSLSPILSLKTDYEKRFLAAHYKQKHDELRQSLEQESWQPADIPYTYGIYFNLIFGIKAAKDTETNSASTRKYSDDILRSSRPYSINDSTLINQLNAEDESTIIEDTSKIEEVKNGKQPEEFYSIKKNEIFINNQRFKTINSFLLLIRILCEDFNMAVRFNNLGKDSVSSIFDIIKFYNSYCIQLILGAGATTFGKVKKITAKTLALSSVSLGLLVELIDPLHARIIEQIPTINQDWLKAEITKVKTDLKNHMNEITAKIRSILKTKLIEQCNELKKMAWGNAQEKVNIPTKYSASILHNTRQIYKTIEDFLSNEQMIEIFNVIFSDIKDIFVPIFANNVVESKLAAKRIKEELKYFCDDLYQIPIFQAPELKYADFEDKIFSILEEKCNHFLEATLIN